MDALQAATKGDIDVHHGDGVANAFCDRDDLMTVSFHESGKTLFPGTGFENEIGTGSGKGYCVNVPLPIGTYDQVYTEAFETIQPLAWVALCSKTSNGREDCEIDKYQLMTNNMI